MNAPISKTTAKRRPLLPPNFVRAMLAGHSALGLAFAALIYIVCISGTIVVFMFELQRWEQPTAPLIYQPASLEAVDTALRQGHAQAVKDNAGHDISILGPSGRDPRLSIHYHDHETGAEGSWLANADGELVTRINAPWTHFITDLHIHLHLPNTWGLFIVGLTGVALLSSIVSGLLSHPRIFKDAFALRWGGSRRLQEADLHNRLSVWGLPFHIAVSVTGALLGLSTLVVGVLALAAYDGDSQRAFAEVLGPQPTADETPAPIPDLRPMIRTIQERKPDAVFVNATVQHIGKAGQIASVGLSTPGHLTFANAYNFDGTGKLLGDNGVEEGSIGKQILGALQPVHFGWFGGMPVKLLYGILGLALSVITYTGVTIWLARRRDSGRPAPKWERVWTAVGWGQPLAIAGSAIAGLLTASEPIILTTYLALTFATLALSVMLKTAAHVSWLCKTGTAVLLTFAAATHIVLWGDKATDPMALYVNIAMVACVAGTILTLRNKPIH